MGGNMTFYESCTPRAMHSSNASKVVLLEARLLHISRESAQCTLCTRACADHRPRRSFVYAG